MNLDEIIEKINIERALCSRFPIRVIFVENLEDYSTLIANLENACDSVINIADYCNSDDVYPNFKDLYSEINQQKEKSILLLSVGEYLRLRINREIQPGEARFSSLWQLQFEASSKTRVFLPLFACKDLFERIILHVDERQKDNIWEFSSASSEHRTLSLSVFSPEFNNALPKAIIGIKKWLSNWTKEWNQQCDCSLITTLYKNIENSNALVNIRVIDNPFDYVCNLVDDGQYLQRDWATEEQWASLIPDLIVKKPLSKTIENLFNVKKIEPIKILATWDVLTDFHRQLLWIWYQLNSTGDYIGYVFKKIKNIKEIKNALRDEIINGNHPPEWIGQRNQALEVLREVVFDEEYFSLLDTITLPETKLALLTYRTHEERAYSISVINKWLNQGVSVIGILEALSGRFFLFEEYIRGEFSENPELNDYFTWYKLQKILNRVPEEPPPTLNLDKFESRYNILCQYEGKDCFVFWIDGMGVEWLPLLNQILKSNINTTDVKYQIAAAILPTETKYNEQWKDLNLPYEKWNRLDSLAHKGLPDDIDYFSCIDNQLQIISEVAKKAKNFLDIHEYVIITADHGSSRLAALSFHKNYGVSAPKNAIIRSYGRYCELHSPTDIADNLPFVQKVKDDNNEYMVMTSHDHYAVSGNPAGGNNEDNAICGEIHGGKTPEEYLIPIVILQRREAIPQIQYKIKNNVVYRDNDKVTVDLEFDFQVVDLEVLAENIFGSCKTNGVNLWVVTFSGLETREYKIEIVANGRKLSKKDSIIVKSKGIEKKDDLFGGF